ncbi:hypothetical protein ACFL0Z_02860 [Patescibacteria group bacterium]
MKKMLLVAILLMVITISLSLAAENTVKLQNAKPGEPGHIDFTRKELRVGEKVYVFNLDAPPEQDVNGFVFPWHFTCFDGVIVAKHKSEMISKIDGTINRTVDYDVEVFWGSKGEKELSRLKCVDVIPEQRVVYYHL